MRGRPRLTSTDGDDAGFDVIDSAEVRLWVTITITACATLR